MNGFLAGWRVLEREVEADVAGDAHGLAVDDGGVELPAAGGVRGGVLQLLRAVGAGDGFDLALLVDDEVDRDDAADAGRARNRGVGGRGLLPRDAVQRADGDGRP